MKSVHDFVVTPKGERYNNTKKLDGGELILNTEIYNHQFVNREATVVSTPIVGHADIRAGDIILEFNGTEINEMKELPKIVAQTKVGKIVEVKIWRNKKEIHH